jgi:hypothetical protein
MLSGKEEIIPQPSQLLVDRESLPNTETDGRLEVDPYEHVQNSLHDTVESAGRTEPWPEGSHEHSCENKIFEIGELEQGVLDLHLQRRPCSPEQRPILHTPESLPRLGSSDVEEEEDRHGVSRGNLEQYQYSKDTPRDEVPDVLNGRPEVVLNPETRQSPSSQPVAVTGTPSALPLHLIPLLPQSSPSPKRQRRSAEFSSNQTENLTDDFGERGGLPSVTGGSPQSLRTQLQTFSAESAGISRTLAYAMDQMHATPLHSAGLEELVTMGGKVDHYSEGDGATKPKTVRFKRQPTELAERLWAEATAKTDEKGEIPQAERGLRYCLYRSGLLTLEEALKSPSKEVTSQMDGNMASCTTEGGSWTVDPEEVEETGSEADWATLASQTQALKPAQLQEYTRLKEREVELRRAGAEVRILEERLEAREKDLRMCLATVRQRLEAARQRKASINSREDIIRQKLEAITKGAQHSDNALGPYATPESS